MVSQYQQEFSFKPVLFTTSPSLISFAKNHTIDVVQDIKTNMHGMPYIRDMMIQILKTYNGLHYGYMNADILFTKDLFKALGVVRDQVDQNRIPSLVIISLCTLLTP